MPTAILGLDAKLYRNTSTTETPTWVEIQNVKDVTLNMEKGEADVTTRAAAGWKQSVATLKEATLEFDMVWDPGDSGLTEIMDAFMQNTSIELAVMDGPIPPAAGQTSQGLRALWTVLKFAPNQPLEEAVTVSVSLKPTYGSTPEWLTETTP